MCKRKNLFFALFLYLIIGQLIIAPTFFIFNIPKAKAAWLTGWEYRTPVAIKNSVGTLTNYQIELDLQGSNSTLPNYIDFDKILAGGADFRVVASDGETLLPFWIEYWNDTDKTAKIWIKLSSLANSTNVTAADYYKFSASSTQHIDYGLSYPVTYEFDIPASETSLTAYIKYSSGGSWSAITEKTTDDYFNGIEAARFDYDNDKAYISAAYSATSDDLYLKIENSSGTQVGTYNQITEYYDNRDAAVVATSDDWDGYNNAAFKNACDAFTAREIWFTAGITKSGIRKYNWSASDWSEIQSKLDAGYIEAAVHGDEHIGDYYSYSYSGNHDGADNNSTTLTDSSASFPVDYSTYTADLSGWTIDNVTDGSSCLITSSDSTSITCSGGLTGGTENDWDSGDVYSIDRYDEEIGDSKTAIINNLDLPSEFKSGSQEYVYTWISPYGYTDGTLRSKLGENDYLAHRNYPTLNHTTSDYDSINKVYGPDDATMWVDGIADATAANAAFDAAVAAGEVFHIAMHPRSVSFSVGAAIFDHLDYIKQKKNIWYPSYGHLYLYKYIREQNISQAITVSGDSLYLYYGKSDASSVSSFDNTFTKDFNETGLMALYHLDGDSTTEVTDSSGNANTGTLTGGTTRPSEGGYWSASSTVNFSTGSALQLNGTTGYFTVAHDDTLNVGTGGLTISLWARMEGDPNGNYPVLVEKSDNDFTGGGSQIGFYLGMPYNNTPSRNIKWALGNGTTKEEILYEISNEDLLNTWHHIVAVAEDQSADDPNMYLYIDGDLVATKSRTLTGSIDATSRSLSVGRWNKFNRVFNGKIDEVRLYNRAMSYAEIMAQYQKKKYTSTEPFALTRPSLSGLNKIFIGVTNTVSDTNGYVDYSDLTSAANSIDFTATPPSGSVDIIATSSSIDLDYQSSTITGLSVSNVDRSLNLNNNDTTSLIIAPSSSSVDLSITTWNTSGTYYKKWTETSSGDVETNHTIGELESGTYYTVWYTKSGGDKTRLTSVQASATSTISFIYDQSYSDVEFEIEEDTTAPSSFNISSPSSGSTITDRTPTFSWSASTDSESGIANYQIYVDGSLNTDSVGSTSGTPGSDLSCGDHTWYIKALDNAGNSTDSNTGSFSISCGGGAYIPPVSIGNGESSAEIGMGQTAENIVVKKEGHNILAYINSKANFSLAGNSQKHTAEIVDLDMQTKKIKIKFQSELITVELNLGESIAVDLNQDGISDIKVIYNDLVINRVDLTVEDLSNLEKNINEGDLVKEYDKAEVYLIQNGKKRHIENEAAFISHGFSWSNIIEVGDLGGYAKGEAITLKTEYQLNYSFNQGLYLGLVSDDVKKLQELLAQYKDIYPEALITGYFGPLTEKAVQKFQLKYKIVNSASDLGYGYVGPKTRAKLNSL